MELPLTIATHDVTLTEPIEKLIREKASKLERFHSRIVGCRVTVDGPDGHHKNGGLYKVRIELSIPGNDIVVNHKGGDNLPVAVRDAFYAAQRQLDEREELRRAERRAS
jgi:ribosome-associated translation inhibitor RaiA